MNLEIANVVGGNLTSRIVAIPAGTINQIETMWLFLKAAGLAFLLYLVYLFLSLIVSVKRAKRIKRIEERLEEIDVKLDKALKKRR